MSDAVAERVAKMRGGLLDLVGGDLSKDPDAFASATAQAMLELGEWTREAWELHRRRVPLLQRLGRHAYTHFPEWDVGDPVTVVVLHEGGFGDSIMGIRYGTTLQALGATRVVWQCPPTLHTLFVGTPGINELASTKPGSRTKAAAAVWLGDLPGLAHAKPGNVGGTRTPYLRRGAFRTVRPVDDLRVGFCWAGGPHTVDDATRSCREPLLWAKLLSVCRENGWSVTSLQRGPDATAPWADGLPNAVLRATDWRATAKAVYDLDLVISVDTAVAHLAGAMDVPTWLLLPDPTPDWRWLTEGSSTGWYPLHVLFRQPQPGQWGACFEQVLAAIETMMRGG